MKAKRSALLILFVIGLIFIAGLAAAEVEPIIADDADLLTVEEEAKLSDYMQPICDYGVPMCWSAHVVGTTHRFVHL